MGQGSTNTLPHKTSSNGSHTSTLVCLWCISDSFFTCIYYLDVSVWLSRDFHLCCESENQGDSVLAVVSSCKDHGIYEYIMRYVYKSLLLICID